ncbi:MAG: hypothetical protein J0L93_04400 [Deltaproteobacteria bacterium]|nr:hypothetical protein [Deltaproteobacteria bacterium]
MRSTLFISIITLAFFSIVSPAFSAPATSGGTSLPASPITHMKIHGFEVIGFNPEKNLLAYKIIFGTKDRTKDVVEWGVADLKQSKVIAHDKSINPKKTAIVFKDFKSKIERTGVNVSSPLPLVSLNQISNALSLEVSVGEKAVKVFRNLNDETRYSLRHHFCPNYDPELSEAAPKKSEMGLLVLKNAKKVLWAEGYCPDQGGITLSARGFIKQGQSFVALINVKGEGGSQDGIKKKFEEIFISPVFLSTEK